RLGRDQLAERPLRVSVGHDRLRPKAAAVSEPHPLGQVAVDEDLRNRRARENLDAVRASALLQCRRDRAHPAPGKGPAAEDALELSRGVIAEEIGGAWGRGTAPDRDDAEEGVEAADLIRGEVAAQQVARGAEQEFVQQLLLA